MWATAPKGRCPPNTRVNFLISVYLSNPLPSKVGLEGLLSSQPSGFSSLFFALLSIFSGLKSVFLNLKLALQTSMPHFFRLRSPLRSAGHQTFGSAHIHSLNLSLKQGIGYRCSSVQYDHVRSLDDWLFTLSLRFNKAFSFLLLLI